MKYNTFVKKAFDCRQTTFKFKNKTSKAIDLLVACFKFFELVHKCFVFCKFTKHCKIKIKSWKWQHCF